jgi:hypothetical protein
VSRSKPRRGRRVNVKGRSIGNDRYARFFHWEIQSPAFRSLSIGARALLIELKTLYNGSNNGQLFLSVREAARRLNRGKNFAAKCLRELEDRGFIRPNVVGAFNLKAGARQGRATTWILTEFEFAGSLATKEFMRWRPAIEGHGRK